MSESTDPSITVSIPRGALEAIFDECDEHNIDETGGRLIGYYRKAGHQYAIQVLGVIGPGPDARRSATSLFQDGEYQERIFRSIEEHHPHIEHLGNWHTHHVNGLSALSAGDKTTYFAIVNHDNHNTDFFYALLIVRRATGHDLRYEVKHYFLRRNDDTLYEIPEASIRLVHTPLLWPHDLERTALASSSFQYPRGQESAPNPQRAKDQDFFVEFYPNLKPLFSKSMAALYWKGSLLLIDGSRADVVAIEKSGGGAPFYSIAAASRNPIFADIAARYGERRFPSARHAVLHLERDLNKALYRGKKG
jgi:hypothetical protein